MAALSDPLPRLLLLTLLVVSSGPAPRTLPSELADIIARRFSRWDLNRDRRLSAHEINQAVADPALRDADAAAIAALKRGLTGNPDATAGLTKDQLQQLVDDRNADGLQFQELFTRAAQRIRQTQ
ncbi:MAG: hypothetical protein ACKPJD_34715, partial [Planctomycetaceae bacterium]